MNVADDRITQAEALAVNLIAVLVAVSDDQPRILTVGGQALPSGPFELAHRSLQSGLRDWVEQQTRHPIGYVEQLYTFADRDRDRVGDGAVARMVSISYLGLTRERPAKAAGLEGDPEWRDWYAFFPWEDRRRFSRAEDAALKARLQDWIEQAGDARSQRIRAQRCAIAFGFEPHGWNEEFVLQRYELLFEAALIPESGPAARSAAQPGLAMAGDHRRILATGVARLRSKIKYRPVVFELLPDTFTLLQLQRSVEALAGRLVHKQNFRRLIEQQELVEDTGALATGTGGRPAKLVRFRRDILDERAVVGTKLPRP